MARRSFRCSWVFALSAATLFGCAAGSTEEGELPPIAVDGGVDTGGFVDGSVDGDDTSVGDTGTDTAADTGTPGCKTNADCASDPAGKFCLPSTDGGKSYCVPCLPAPFDECGHGEYCSDKTYTCESGCKDDTDCKAAPSGDAGADAGDAGDDAADAGDDAADVGGDAGKPLVCDKVKHVCVGCTDDPDCPAGFLCDRPSGSCVPGCNTMKPCPTDKECCSGTCFDIQKDVKNCGSCGNVCPTPANATAACTAGVCGIGICNTGYGDCNASAADGCETNLQNNKDNCGACGTVCSLANATAACTAGACTIATCNGTYDDCDKIASNGCETSLRTESDCGACGSLCLIPNGSGSCTTGTCLLTGCNPGYGNCDGLASNGCETNTAGGVPGPGGSILNCGTCGTSCSVAYGSPQCSAGTCAVQSCTAPYANCNGLYADGCESNTNIDVNNCGGCGNACNSTNGTATCAAATCGIVCNPGFGNCDGLVANGCETNTSNDKNNCGACGTVCATSATVLATTCSAGSCAVATCADKTYNRNGLFSDGCECAEDVGGEVGNNCGAAKSVGPINMGAAATVVSGTLVNAADNDEDWYKISFQVSPNSCSYRPNIVLTGPASVKMQVFTTCGGSTPSGSFTCGGGTEPASSAVAAGVTTWEFNFPAGTCGDKLARDPTPDTSPTFLNDNGDGEVFVRVFRAASAPICYDYTLTIRNN